MSTEGLSFESWLERARLRRERLDPHQISVLEAALLVWLVMAAVTEQFAWVDDARGVAVGVAWLVPPAVGTVILLRRREWWGGAGCSVALFAGATSLVYSVTHTGSGVGLMFAWQS